MVGGEQQPLAVAVGNLGHASILVRPPTRADVDDVAVGQLELVGLGLRELDDRLARRRSSVELDAHLEAEVHDALDLRLGRARGSGSGAILTSCGRTSSEPSRVTGPEEAHDERRSPGARRARAGAPTCSMRPSFITAITVGDLHRLLLVVRDEHGRDVDLVVQAPQPRAQLGADLRVQRAERLVEQQHARLDRQRARERHALALAAAELRRVALRVAGEPDDPEQLVRRARRSPPSGACGRCRPNATFSHTVMCLNAA